MKKWPKSFIFVFALVFLFSNIIPVKADGEHPITFHVLYVNPTQTIVDAEGTITWAGSFTNPECTGIQCSDQLIHGGGLSLHNNCTGTGCTAQDIYWKAVITGTWQTPFYEDNRIPELIFTQGKPGDTQTYTCVGSGEYGTCNFTASGMIPADEISTNTDTNEVHETFGFYFGWPYGRITSLNYSIIVSTSPIPDADCSSQWLPGSKFASFTLGANNSAGQNLSQLSGWPEPGSWIIVRVASGTWLNNGTGTPLTSLSLSDGANEWHTLSTYQNTGCSQSSSYYMQISQKFYNYFLRVADSDGNFSSNTGALNIELYYSTYSPFRTGCDANYKIGALIDSRTTQANLEDGIYITGTDSRLKDLQAMGGEEYSPKILMLEIDVGPYWNGVSYSYAAEIKDQIGWVADYALSAALCVVHLDTMGKVRIYFPWDDSLIQWKFRAADTDGYYANNLGNIGFSLYYVDQLQIYNPGDPGMDCSKYSHDVSGTSITIQGNASSNHSLTLTGNELYAIQTSAGPWSNNGVLSFDIAISDDGIIWHNLYDYPYILCASVAGSDNTHAIVYFQAMPGKVYHLRVNDPGGVYSDNTGSIVATVYGADTTIANWDACSDDVTFTKINIDESARHIPAQYTDGVNIPYIENGKVYALEISDVSSWSVNGSTTPRFDAEISDDGGITWQQYQLADFASCVVIKHKGDAITTRYRIIFTADGTYKMRVHGADPSNTGDLVYDLYDAILNAPGVSSSNSGTTGYVPPEWKTTCYEVCNRPVSLVIFETFSLGTITFGDLGSVTFPGVTLPIPDVGGWLDYARCALQKFLSVCPEHIQALLSIRDMFDDREPFGTVVELEASATSVKAQLDALVSAGGEDGQQYAPYSVIWNSGGGETGTDWGGILPNAQGTPWDGTPLDLSNVTTDAAAGGEAYTSTAYYSYCLTAMGSLLGEFDQSFCSGISFIKTTMNWLFISLGIVFDIGTLYLAFAYVKHNWIDKK